jgi:hypothetical protein
MPLEIKRGKVGRPQRTVIYAPEGFGKSTLGSQFPAPLFIDLEESTHQMDVDRIEPAIFAEVEQACRDLAANPQGYKSVVIDTADWLEGLLSRHICENARKESIEDFGYGKGYVVIGEKFAKFLPLLDGLIDAGLHVVLLAHSKITKFEQPDAQGSYDRWGLKLGKHTFPLVKEWADLLLFGQWKVNVAENESGRNKATGGRERIMRCTHSAAWDAKNRHGLADSEPWHIDTIKKAFASVGAPWDAAPAPSKPLTEYTYGQKSREEKPDDDIAMSGPGADLIPSLETLFKGKELDVTGYALSRGWIQSGQSWRDISRVSANAILANPDKFMKAVAK